MENRGRETLGETGQIVGIHQWIYGTNFKIKPLIIWQAQNLCRNLQTDNKNRFLCAFDHSV